MREVNAGVLGKGLELLSVNGIIIYHDFLPPRRGSLHGGESGLRSYLWSMQ